MQEGTIKNLVRDKGFGFISRDGVEGDLFFHANELEGVAFDDLDRGMKVTFEIGESPKGLNATGVKLAE